MGGSKKILPDNARLRGDCHVLLLGDPGVAKSQLLKFVQKVSYPVHHVGLIADTVVGLSNIGVHFGEGIFSCWFDCICSAGSCLGKQYDVLS